MILNLQWLFSESASYQDWIIVLVDSDKTKSPDLDGENEPSILLDLKHLNPIIQGVSKRMPHFGFVHSSASKVVKLKVS